MQILADVHSRLAALDARAELNVESHELLKVLRLLPSDDLVDVLAQASSARTSLERFVTIGAAVVAERSVRELGQGGLAATQGHRTPVSLVQSIAGVSKAEAARVVRAGQSLLDDPPTGEGETRCLPWHDELRRAMIDGIITPAQHEAVLRGLGEPPASDQVDDDTLRHVWALAAERLMADAGAHTIEDLFTRARQARDVLDPAGVEERFARRYEKRSFRIFSDADGQKRAVITLDDEGAAWIESMMAAALRPRRGGPRFMTDDERAQADTLIADPRTNDQISYDLFMSVVRAGALAEASDVFGARQPGVRMIVVRHTVGPRDPFGRLLAVGHLEDGGDAVPGSVLERALCETGSIDVTVDSCGNPLDVGREQRLFTPRQRIALAARDGGCMWPGCTIHASYCEAHHADEWRADRGNTDVGRGLLLCRFHHMLLHNQGYRVSRDGNGPFILTGPSFEAGGVELKSKSPVKWAWDPPPLSRSRGWREAGGAPTKTSSHAPSRARRAERDPAELARV